MNYETPSLAPGLLLASPALSDPNFKEAVVLLGHHDEDGALGWVLNGRALGPASTLLVDSGLTPPGTRLSGPSYARHVRLGGPVLPGSAWLLFQRTPEIPSYDGQTPLDEDYAVTSNSDAITALANGNGPLNFRLVLGYAGWGPKQLETEIQAGAWLPAALDPELLLLADPETLWSVAYQRSVGALPVAFNTMARGRA